MQAGRQFLSFSVPLLSSVLGILMPPELFKYIPLAIFEDLVIELRVSQYALYSSGYKSSTSIDPYHNEGLDVSPLA